MTKPATVDEYVAGLPPAAKRVVKRLRRTIRRALPDAQEVISYSIPAYKQFGRIVVYVAAWKSHYSIYPSTRQLEQRFRKELDGYEKSGKGTIQFPLDEPIPEALITKLVRFRANEVAEGARLRAASRKKGTLEAAKPGGTGRTQATAVKRAAMTRSTPVRTTKPASGRAGKGR